MTDRLTPNVAIDALSLGLADLPLEPTDIELGEPRAALAELLDTPELAVGVWELSAGVVRDTEVDEIFIVLSGEATVELDGSPAVLHLSAGTVGRLAAGTRSRWTVTETLRKVYITAAIPSEASTAESGS